MSDSLKKVRRGTKSCTECRRRKVRCTWSSDDAPRCRRCEERGSNCVAQVYSIQSSVARRITSRDRIARLEQQVTNLTKALQSDDQDTRQSLASFDTPMTEFDNATASDSGDDSMESDGFLREPPSHLSTLFENDLISTDVASKHGHDSHKAKVVTELSTDARYKLQELIPPKEEVEIIASFASGWLSLFHSLFPAPSMIKSGQEMVTQYEAIKSPTVDPAYLGSWLLSIAMTIHQVPKGQLGPEDQLKGFRNASQFSKSVSDVVESTIMRHDALLGTIPGIDAALLFLRLQLSRGNFKKTWLQLRRVIAVAELMGLHRASRRAGPFHNVPKEGDIWPEAELSVARKAQVWESLCSVDRIAGMMFNLPPGTRRYRVPQHTNIISDGKISLRAYLSSLSEIAMKVQDLDDLDLPQDGDAELYANVLKIDGEMRVLASVTPASWWNNSTHQSDLLLQFWHFYINIRVHLPFTLRHDTSDQYSFSRLACMKACQTLVQRYQHIRDKLPNGFFLCRIIDLQVFTAIVVLILAYHAASPQERANLHAHGSTPPELLVPQVLEFMKSILHDPIAGYARQAVEATSVLMQLLDGDTQKPLPEGLKLKVPLLGKLHIRRKESHGKPQKPSQHATIGFGTAHITPPASSVTSDQHGQGIDTSAVTQFDENYSWDPWSWSIEDDQSGVFQDALIGDDYSPFGFWMDQSGAEMRQ